MGIFQPDAFGNRGTFIVSVNGCIGVSAQEKPLYTPSTRLTIGDILRWCKRKYMYLLDRK